MSSRALRYATAAVFLVAAAACSGGGADRTVAFESNDYAYAGLDGFVGKAGETVRFEMRNIGPEEHEFEVFGPDGEVLGEIEPTASGRTGTVTLALTAPGTYRFVCGVEDHEARGMAGSFVVR